LPGCAHVEKRGTFINTKGRVQKFLKVVEPPGDARPESEFLGELLKQLNVQINYASAEGLFNQMVAEVPAFKDLSWAKIGDLGVDVPV
jgi:predicted molibdopterin-dependent oxidoreductase YjgC